MGLDRVFRQEKAGGDFLVAPAPRQALKHIHLRPIYHHKSERIEAHLFVAFLAYGPSITLRQRLKALAGGLMPRGVFEKLATLQLLDVRVPTTDGGELLLVRRTNRVGTSRCCWLNRQLPPQPPPRITQPKTN